MPKLWSMIGSNGVIARKLLSKNDFSNRISLKENEELISEFKDYLEKGGDYKIQFAGIIGNSACFEDNELCFSPTISDPYNSPLRNIFPAQFNYFFDDLGKARRPRKKDILPDNLKVYLELSIDEEWRTTDGRVRRRYRFEAYRPKPSIDKNTMSEVTKIVKRIDHEALEQAMISEMNDKQFEKWLETTIDESASIEEKEGLIKTRKYKREVILDLKRIYNGKCQICKRSTVNEYKVDISEAHHIDLFSKTCDNSRKNIIILCPNHHRLIHAGEFDFYREKTEFISGKYRLEVKLDKHLKIY